MVSQSTFERALRELPFLSGLRPDEVVRAARHFRRETLAAGGARPTGESGAELLLVLAGAVEVLTAPLAGQERVSAVLRAGDHFGEIALATGRPQPATITARAESELARLDSAGLAALFDEFPAAAVPVCAQVAEEVRFKDGLIRELGEIEALGLTGAELEVALRARRRRLRGRGARIVRRAAAAAYREVVVERGREPAFWMLLGFLGSLAGARLVVGLILKYHLQEKLFALVKGAQDANPMHVHHFNYGLLLVILSGVMAFLPQTRRLIRLVSVVFGIGAGLVFDEWALIWNLDPNYYQSLSYFAAAGFAALLLQLAMFRRFWAAVLRRYGGRFAS